MKLLGIGTLTYVIAMASRLIFPAPAWYMDKYSVLSALTAKAAKHARTGMGRPISGAGKTTKWGGNGTAGVFWVTGSR